MIFSAALRVGRWAVGVQSSPPWWGIESVAQDGAWLVAFHAGGFPVPDSDDFFKVAEPEGDDPGIP